MARVPRAGACLQQFADGLWLHDGQIRFFGFRLQRCMTVARLGDGRLWVHSPNTLDAELRAALDALGPVGFVVTPNKMHGHAIDQFAAAYPDARCFAAPGLPQRRPRLHFDGLLGDRPEPAWAETLDQAIVEGNAFFREVVFLHRASATLIVGDLIENLHRAHLSPWGRLVCAACGLYGRVAPSPEHSLYLLDPAAAKASLARIAAWPFERVVPAHGDRIEADGHRAFTQVADRLVRRARWRGRLLRELLGMVGQLQ